MTKPLTVLCALATLFVSVTASAQEEVPMTPTPTPTPAVSPIPTFPEKGAGNTTASSGGMDTKVRIDSGGMFGAGFMIGNTSTGANGKLWFSEDLAVQFSAGSGPLGNNLRFQFDVLYAFFRWEAEDGLYALPFYVGVGGQAGIYWKYPWPDDRTDVGVRVPVGMSVVVPDNPVEIYFEVAPDFAIYHDDATDDDHEVFFIDGQIGVRYYF